MIRHFETHSHLRLAIWLSKYACIFRFNCIKCNRNDITSFEASTVQWTYVRFYIVYFGSSQGLGTMNWIPEYFIRTPIERVKIWKWESFILYWSLEAFKISCVFDNVWNVQKMHRNFFSVAIYQLQPPDLMNEKPSYIFIILFAKKFRCWFTAYSCHRIINLNWIHLCIY